MSMTNEQINALTDAQINVMFWVEDRDYCNDPAAMMPLVFSEGIGLYPERFGDSDVWVAAKSIYKANNFRHAKPLRAAAIVYLKMKWVL